MPYPFCIIPFFFLIVLTEVNAVIKRNRKSGAAAALRVAHFIDLPPEAVAGSVGVHIVQDCYCTVENFCSIPVLTSDTIRLVCRGFEVTVEGKGLVAQEVSNGIVVLRGRINSVSYKRGV